MLLSGMSTIVVTPPAAAARVALSKPSHSVRPGSLTWTWVSHEPGQQHLVVGELHDLGGAGVGVVRRTSATRPSRTRTAAGASRPPTTARPGAEQGTQLPR